MIVGTPAEWMLWVARTKLAIAMHTDFWATNPKETMQITQDVQLLRERIREDKLSGWWPGDPE